MQRAECVLRWMFICFLLSYFLVPYGTKYLHYGLHNIILLTLLPLCFWWAWRFPLLSRWEMILLIGGSVSLGFSAAYHQASFGEFRAYLLAFATYFVVRVGIRLLPLKRLVDGLAVYVAIAGGLAFLQIYGGAFFYPAVYLSNEKPFYAVGFAHHPSPGALLFVWPLAILAGEIVRRPFHSPLLLIAFVLGSYGLGLTFSRGALLGFAMILLLLGLLALRSRATFLRWGLVIVLAALSLVLAWTLPNRYTNVAMEKILSLPTKPEQPVLTKPERFQFIQELLFERLLLWRAVVEIIRNYPLLGVGVKGYFERLPDYLSRQNPRWFSDVGKKLFSKKGPHNSYLTWIVFWGLISFIWVVGLIGLAFWKWASVSGWKLGVGTSFILGLIAVLIDSAFHDFIGDRLFWIAVATAVGVISFKEQSHS